MYPATWVICIWLFSDPSVLHNLLMDPTICFLCVLVGKWKCVADSIHSSWGYKRYHHYVFIHCSAVSGNKFLKVREKSGKSQKVINTNLWVGKLTYWRKVRENWNYNTSDLLPSKAGSNISGQFNLSYVCLEVEAGGHHYLAFWLMKFYFYQGIWKLMACVEGSRLINNSVWPPGAFIHMFKHIFGLIIFNRFDFYFLLFQVMIIKK